MPRPELVPFSSGRTSEMGSVEGRRDSERGSRPFPPAEPGRKQSRGGRLGATACAARAGLRPPRPSVPGSLEGLPLLPELLHGARGRGRGQGRGRGRAHVLLGFP